MLAMVKAPVIPRRLAGICTTTSCSSPGCMSRIMTRPDFSGELSVRSLEDRHLEEDGS